MAKIGNLTVPATGTIEFPASGIYVVSATLEAHPSNGGVIYVKKASEISTSIVASSSTIDSLASSSSTITNGVSSSTSTFFNVCVVITKAWACPYPADLTINPLACPYTFISILTINAWVCARPNRPERMDACACPVWTYLLIIVEFACPYELTVVLINPWALPDLL